MDGEVKDVGGDLPGPIRRFWGWVALSGDRRILTAALLLLAFFFIGPVGHQVIPSTQQSLANQHTTVPLVSALLSGTFFLFSIVVSINSLYVSQQQNPLAQQFGRIQSVVQFRRQLEEVTDTAHVPAQPEPLLRLLSGDILERAQFLEEELHTADLDLRRDLDAYVGSLAEETGAMNRKLTGATGSLDVVLAMMDYNHDRQINDLRQLQAEHGDQLDDGVGDSIEEMLRLLQYFATAREYFKTLYTRREFARLSRDLTLITVPAVAVVASFLHFLNDLPDNHMLIAGVEAVAFAPFVLVATYILRVAIISKRTQAAGQFVAGGGAGAIEGIPPED